MRRPLGIVYDFDGVLADTVGAHTEARLRAFERLGFSTDPAIHNEAHRQGSHPSEIIGWILKEIGAVPRTADVLTDPVVQEVVALKGEIYKEEAAAGLNAMDGAVALVGASMAHYGRPLYGRPRNLAIATTASVEHEVMPFMEKYGAYRWIKTIVGKEDTPAGQMKPDPFVYLEAARRLEIAPADLLAVEDSPRGIQSAVAAGIPVVGVMTTHDYKELTLADYVVESLPAAIELLSEL